MSIDTGTTGLNVESLGEVERALGSAPEGTSSSIGKAVALLMAFDRRNPIGVSELARNANLTKSTAFRLLSLLTDCQMVEKVGSRYQLGLRLFELGNNVAHCCPHSLREVAHPYLEDLYEATHETVHLAVLDGTDVLYIDKLFGHNFARTPSRVGSRLPAHCTALGKVLLAHGDVSDSETVVAGPLNRVTRYTITQHHLLEAELSTVVDLGVAFDREEVGLGVVCVAAPIFDRRQNLVAAVSVAGASGRFDPNQYVHRLRSTASGIGALLNG